MIGKKIFNYQIKKRIGSGGMGDVYVAEHASIGREVAIKVLHSEMINHEQVRKRFRNEAKVMARLQHPNIVGLYDFHEDESGLYLIMEYVKGIELDEEIKNLNAPMELERAMSLWRQILEAFKYAHSNGVVHRDVKPSNIIIDDQGTVKVLDFGVAKIVGNEQFNLTKEGSNVGTAYYMSPEQVKGQDVDHRSDIYSLGVTFYEMLAGYSPVKAHTTEYDIYQEIVNNPLKSLVDTMGSQYSDAWEVIFKATEKNPKDRFQSVQEMLMYKHKGSASPKEKNNAESISGQPELASPVLKSKSKRNSKLLVVGIALLIAAVVIIVNMQSSGTGAENELDDNEVNMEDSNGNEQGNKQENTSPPRNPVPNLSASASSTYPAGSNLTFSPSNAVDGNLKTWWSPKSSNNEWLKVHLSGTFTLDGINIHGGSHYPHYSSNGRNYGNIYFQNYRLNRVRLEFSNGDYEIHTISDVDRIQTIYFNRSHRTSYVKVVPLTYYPTTNWKDVCISEISVIWR